MNEEVSITVLILSMLQAGVFPQLHERYLEATITQQQLLSSNYPATITQQQLPSNNYPATLKTEAVYTIQQTPKPADKHDAK
jgi:hypothetical protein